jgi:hypothetical protein
MNVVAVLLHRNGALASFAEQHWILADFETLPSHRRVVAVHILDDGRSPIEIQNCGHCSARFPQDQAMPTVAKLHAAQPYSSVLGAGTKRIADQPLLQIRVSQGGASWSGVVSLRHKSS